MGTLAEKLDYLSGTKDAIKDALIEKGVVVSDSDTFRSYAGKIDDLASNDYIGFNSETVPYIARFDLLTGTQTRRYGVTKMLNNSDYSIEFCLLFGQTVGSEGRIIEFSPTSSAGSSNSSFSLDVDNNKIYFGTRTTSGELNWGSQIGSITNNTFHTFSIVVDNTNSTIQLYDNGTLFHSYDNINLYYADVDYYIWTKYGPTSNRVISGDSYSLRNYRRVLSAQEILHNYQIDYDKFYEEPTS